jgi:hypothetical protein
MPGGMRIAGIIRVGAKGSGAACGGNSGVTGVGITSNTGPQLGMPSVQAKSLATSLPSAIMR